MTAAPPKIKICGLKYPENIKDILSLMPDYIGFIFYKQSPRYFAESMVPEFILEIKKPVLKVGVFVNEEFDEILNYSKLYKFDYVQLHGEESVEYCKTLKKEGLSIIKAFRINNNFHFSDTEKYINCADYFIFDTKTNVYGGSGEKFDWNLLNTFQAKDFFLSGGLDLESLNDIKSIENKHLYALDLNSRFEINPGFKDVKKLEHFINEIRNLKYI